METQIVLHEYYVLNQYFYSLLRLCWYALNDYAYQMFVLRLEANI